MENDNNLDELLERASEDQLEKNEEVIEEEQENNIDTHVNNAEFSGYFHERDSLTENNIVSEVSTSFLEYSMSVITARALPDLRDGLKPVNRRILWAMYESGYTPDKPHRKSATTVGYVMGNYHPHGDSSIYEAMVRMAQDFNQRYMLVDGHGNFGNIEGDGAAAMRYTESRLAKLSLELLRDIRKETVDMDDNFDFTKKEPKVLPSRFPNILVNGTMGIAVGMATNIPPHNLGEVIDGCIAYIDNPDIDVDGLMKFIKGPDFPTGGIILGNKGIKQAYETGRGGIVIRSKATIEEHNNHNAIVITEVPYGVNTLELKNRVAELVHNKIIDGISDYHTDLKDGVKITITLKKDANPQVVLNNLYKHTNFQVNYGIILLMLDNGVPRTLGLKSIISKYIDHQKEVIIRRTKYELNEDEKKVHILEGLKIALDNIDEVVSIIRAASDDQEAKSKLMARFGLSEVQSDNILEMCLKRLTGLERDKIESDLNELLKEIDYLKSVLASEQKVLDIIKEEMLEIKKKYADERRTHIDMTAIEYIEDESLIPEENIVVALSHNGYIKRTNVGTYKTQHRGGVGVKGMGTNEEDYIEQLVNLSTHDHLLFFTNKGKVYRVKGYEIPEYGRASKGLPVINLLSIEKDERVNSIIPVSQSETDVDYLFFATKEGIVKKTLLSEFENIRNSGKICINLKETDELAGVKKVKKGDYILLASDAGRMVRFNETDVRVMGRTASGVRGINLEKENKCICLEVVKDEDNILLITEKGYGKQTKVLEYRQTKRGSKGVKALNITEKNGILSAVKLVVPENDVIIMTNQGMVVRIPINQISELGRVTQGVRVINLKDGQLVAAVSLVSSDDDNDDQVVPEVTTGNNEEVSRETEQN
ncbi:MAG: DNA gyrase subunit A [Bacilli bacterium]|nr:DNA gyrase subunit A [Bacilli bacterium]